MFRTFQHIIKNFAYQNFKINFLNRNLSYSVKNTLQKTTTTNNFIFSNNVKSEHQFPIIDSRIPYKKIEDLPLIPNKIIENPINSLLNEINDIIKKQYNGINEITMPSLQNNIEKQAARLVVIRRRKMKKHKLKKLRKKMKFEWAKVRQRREMRKEKAFQAELIAQIKDAEKFSAEKYVAEKLRQLNETPKSRFTNGERLS